MKRNREVAYALMRVALGVNMFGHGFFRILAGTGAFAHGMAKGMAQGPLPPGLSLAFGYCIPWLELTLGVLLICGFLTTYALAAGAIFMVILTFGTTSVQNWNGAGSQLTYSLVFFALLWLAECNSFSLDALLARRNV